MGSPTTPSVEGHWFVNVDTWLPLEGSSQCNPLIIYKSYIQLQKDKDKQVLRKNLPWFSLPSREAKFLGVGSSELKAVSEINQLA